MRQWVLDNLRDMLHLGVLSDLFDDLRLENFYFLCIFQFLVTLAFSRSVDDSLVNLVVSLIALLELLQVIIVQSEEPMRRALLSFLLLCNRFHR